MQRAPAIRVAYDCQIFGTYRYGGVSRYVYELARRVGHMPGFSARVIAPFYSNRYLASGGVRTIGLLVNRFPRPNRAFEAINRLVELAALHAIRPDVVHESYYQRTGRAPHGARIVVTVHDMIHEKFPQYFDADGIAERKRAAVARADRVVCVSENTRRDLVDCLGTDPSRISVIHLGSSLAGIAVSGNAGRTQRPYFLFVGLRAGYKNFDRTLQAWASLPDLARSFDLVAFGANGFSKSETDRMEALGINPARVIHVDGDDGVLATLYRGATALIYPSIYEGFGIPPLEAMSLGCPVLCSSSSSIPEVVGDAGIYFDPEDASQIAAAIDCVARSAEVRTDLVRRGLDRAALFSWDRCAEQTARVYRSLA